MSKNQTGARRARTSRSPSRNLADDPKVGQDLIGARAATLTAVLAMEGSGSVYGQIATSLRIHVLDALERIEAAVTGEVRP